MIVKNLVSTKVYYDKNGQEKKSYTKVGVIFIYEDGGMSIKMEAIPLNWDGTANAYEIDNRQGNEHDNRNNSMGNNGNNSTNNRENNNVDNMENNTNSNGSNRNKNSNGNDMNNREQQSMNYEKRQ